MPTTYQEHFDPNIFGAELLSSFERQQIAERNCSTIIFFQFYTDLKIISKSKGIDIEKIMCFNFSYD